MPRANRPTRRTEHLFLGVLGLTAIALHIFLFWDFYAIPLSRGMGSLAIGEGSLFWANLLILVAILGALTLLIVATVRSFRARAGTGYLPTLLLLGAGMLVPWAGIAISFFIADAGT